MTELDDSHLLAAGPDAAEEPDVIFAPWDGRRVPVTLIGGYLGAGKTTVVNELLARTDRPIAVLVNDVGSVNVDASLIKARSADTMELTDGCICCSLAAGLAAAFTDLRERPEPPEHVVIELSGVADPRNVIPWANSPGFRLDAVVVLADGEQVEARLDDEVTAPYIEGQLLAADLIVVTKIDLIDESRLRSVRARLDAIAPNVPIVESGPDVVAGLIDTATRREGGVAATPAPRLFDAHATWTIEVPVPVERSTLEEVLDGLDDDVVRAKGVAELPGGQRLLVQVVGHRREIAPLPGAEDQPPTDLVVISLLR